MYRSRLLGLGGEWGGEGASQRGEQEAAAVHAETVAGLARQAGTMHGHPNSRISASAFSSQYVMPISRYTGPHALFGPHV